MSEQKNEPNCDGGKCEISNVENKKTQTLELEVSDWLNTDGKDLKLSDLLGKVVVIDVFQMLCPACVNHSLPQASRLHSFFRDQSKVCVIGLHSVFEHHEAMQKESLKAFLYEFRYDFPVAIDKYLNNSPIPETMKKYNLQGTPSLIIIDQEGNLKEILFGVVDDLVLGLKIGKLLDGK